MIEEILAGHPSPFDAKEFRQLIAETEMQIFCIDNVAEYLYAQTAQEEWHPKEDFPCLAPPFRTFWMEYGRPSKIVSSLFGTRGNQDLPYRVGFFFHSAALEEFAQELSSERALKNVAALREQLLERCSPENRLEVKQALADGANIGNPLDPRWGQMSPGAREFLNLLAHEVARERFLRDPARMSADLAKTGLRWTLSCTIFLQLFRHGAILGPLGEHTLQIDAEGRAMGQSIWSFNHRLIDEANAGPIAAIWFPALLAISFCHCKNVTIQSQQFADAAVTKRRTRDGHPPVVFKVLEIEPMKTVLQKAGSEHAGLKRALHICRGHFAEYQDRGLFGKYKGRFWISQHVRGSAKQGAVVKDYAIRSPKVKKE